jgi:hypothetical protein
MGDQGHGNDHHGDVFHSKKAHVTNVYTFAEIPQKVIGNRTNEIEHDP